MEEVTPAEAAERVPAPPEAVAHEAFSEARLGETHPRYRIRSFLRRLYGFLGEPLPAAWPAVDATCYGALRLLLRQRLDQWYSYLEGQATFTIDQQLMPRYIGETAMYLLELDFAQPESRHDPPEELVAYLADRPPAITDFDQLYCTPDSAQRRVDRILRDFGSQEGAKVLFLGDDDLGSVALAPHFAGEIHMVDLDQRLHDYIERKAPSVVRHKADFILSGLDRALCEAFDAVVLDPPWDFYRLWCFLDKAIFCLKQSPHAKIYLSYCPLVLEHRQKMLAHFQKRVASRAMTFDSIESAFNLYGLDAQDLPDFQQRLEPHLPPIESPLLDLLRQLPYAHTQLYVLRRLPHTSMGWLRRTFFHWWNRA